LQASIVNVTAVDGNSSGVDLLHARTHASHAQASRATAALKLIASTGFRNASIDLQADRERGIVVASTGYEPTLMIETTWALILASCATQQSSSGYK